VTLRRDHYEQGAFDVRGPEPRATAIAKVATRLAQDKEVNHALLEVPGWWRRPERLVHGVIYDDHGAPSNIRQNWPDSHIRPVLIAGGRGTLGRAFARGCVLRGIPHRVLIRSEADNTAGYVRVDDAEQDRDACFRENTLGPRILAQECERKNIRLVTFSSDLIFNGSKFAQYIEPDSPAPLNVYGESKLLAEMHVLNTCPSALVIRTSAFFGPWDEHNFVYAALKACVENRRFRAAADVTVSPTYHSIF
jgi:dTDP-4-dehydrorhamnose reductase